MRDVTIRDYIGNAKELTAEKVRNMSDIDRRTILDLPSVQPEKRTETHACDCIDRQAAIDAADEIIARDESGNNDVVKAMTAWKEYIKDLPSAQPEIIRCKDCRYAKMTHTGECKYCTYLADNFGIDDAVYFEGNDYCSHAERRSDETD